eukprot:gene15333-6553_t
MANRQALLASPTGNYRNGGSCQRIFATEEGTRLCGAGNGKSRLGTGVLLDDSQKWTARATTALAAGPEQGSQLGLDFLDSHRSICSKQCMLRITASIDVTYGIRLPWIVYRLGLNPQATISESMKFTQHLTEDRRKKLGGQAHTLAKADKKSCYGKHLSSFEIKRCPFLWSDSTTCSLLVASKGTWSAVCQKPKVKQYTEALGEKWAMALRSPTDQNPSDLGNKEAVGLPQRTQTRRRTGRCCLSSSECEITTLNGQALPGQMPNRNNPTETEGHCQRIFSHPAIRRGTSSLWTAGTNPIRGPCRKPGFYIHHRSASIAFIWPHVRTIVTPSAIGQYDIPTLQVRVIIGILTE